MRPVVPLERSRRRVPTVECRLCSAQLAIDASTSDDLRRGLRDFMSVHRHDGVADIVIDICDDDGSADGEGPPVSRR